MQAMAQDEGEYYQEINNHVSKTVNDQLFWSSEDANGPCGEICIRVCQHSAYTLAFWCYNQVLRMNIKQAKEASQQDAMASLRDTFEWLSVFGSSPKLV